MPEKLFDCDNCVALCCTDTYLVDVKPHEVKRLSRFLGIKQKTFKRKYTRKSDKDIVLKQIEDRHVPERKVCVFLDHDTRKCLVYEARPDTCSEYPSAKRCHLYDLLQGARRHHDDMSLVPLVQLVNDNPRRRMLKDDE